MLFANGKLIQAIEAADDSEVKTRGVQWVHTWKMPRPKHDVHLVAIAIGPGVEGLYWRTAKPYQPTSPDPRTHVIGCSGAVWLDVDGDGRRTSARDYAERLMTDRDDFARLCVRLSDYDEATAAQVAHLLRTSGVSLQNERLQSAVKLASATVQAGFRRYEEAWRENEIARSAP